MRKNNIFSRSKIQINLTGFSHRKFRFKNWDISLFVILGIISILTIGYQVIIKGGDKKDIQYSLSDVVYGEKIIAVHQMNGELDAIEKKTVSKDPVLNPKLQLSADFFDFGRISSEQTLTHTFIITNIGNSTLIIKYAYTTCPCTMAEISASVIPSGKMALITLQFDADYHRMIGVTVRRGLIMATNDPEHPIQEIWIQATVQ